MNLRTGSWLLALAATLMFVSGCEAGDEDPQRQAVPQEEAEENIAIATLRDFERAQVLLGKPVQIRGVVTADYRQPGQIGGVFVQQPQPATSDRSAAMFIRVDATEPIAVGDQITVRGVLAEVGERPRLKPIANDTSLEIRNDGPATVVSPIDLSLQNQDIDWQTLDGMLVRFPADLIVTETYDLGRYGQVTLAEGKQLLTPTDYIDPNDPDPSGNNTTGNNNVEAIHAAEARDQKHSIVLDDGSAEQNRKDIFLFPTTTDPQTPATLRLGTKLKNLTGVVTKVKDRYMVMPAGAIDIQYAPRPAFPDLGQPDLTIASFNVLNYYTTIDDGQNQARGADSVEELARQQEKLVAALVQLDADVVGLMELENSLNSEQVLLDALNRAVAGKPFVGVGFPEGFADAPGGDYPVRVGIIYRRDRVEPIGRVEMVVDPAFANARTPLVQAFRRLGDEARFSVIVNHFKSKGSRDATGEDRDQNDGQAANNASRRNQAAAMLRYVESVRQQGRKNLLILGDLNAYAQEDPIDMLRSGGLVDLLIADDGEPHPYSYVYYGKAGRLDHALATAEFAAWVTRAAIWNINSAEPRLLDYNLEHNPQHLYRPDPYRSSDHDPVLIGIDLP